MCCFNRETSQLAHLSCVTTERYFSQLAHWKLNLLTIPISNSVIALPRSCPRFIKTTNDRRRCLMFRVGAPFHTKFPYLLDERRRGSITSDSEDTGVCRVCCNHSGSHGAPTLVDGFGNNQLQKGELEELSCNTTFNLKSSI